MAESWSTFADSLTRDADRVRCGAVACDDIADAIDSMSQAERDALAAIAEELEDSARAYAVATAAINRLVRKIRATGG